MGQGLGWRGGQGDTALAQLSLREALEQPNSTATTMWVGSVSDPSSRRG